uniref:Putative neuropeptide receptor NPR1 n=1 Tax=Girardia tigrina TaxID=6162 RepID=Q964E5_GIRTI|nr:putative neuropeptide receptor NPR1 [Girardia tigrina]
MNSTNVTTDPIWKWTSFKAVLFFLYSVVFVLASVGNYLVVLVVVKNKSMQTITNLFITNLALADILTTLIAVPFTPIAVYTEEWIFPATLCKLLPMTMGLSVYVSTLTSTAIALDRYIVIVHPFIPRMKMKVCILIIFCIWVIGTLITSPLAIFQKKQFFNDTNKTECREDWINPVSREIFTTLNFVLQFVLPGLIISLCYFYVGKVLKMRGVNKIGCGVKSREREEMEVKRKRRTNHMLIAMVTIFIICWTPLNMLWIISEILGKFDVFISDSRNFFLIFLCSHLTAMSGTMYNPLLYGWMNKNFRMEFQRVLPCLKFRSDIPTKTMVEENTHFKRISEYHDSSPNQELSVQNRPSVDSTEHNKSPLLQRAPTQATSMVGTKCPPCEYVSLLVEIEFVFFL